MCPSRNYQLRHKGALAEASRHGWIHGIITSADGVRFVILVVCSVFALAAAVSSLARQLWPFRRSVSMLPVGQFILGAAALALSIAANRSLHMLTIGCLAGAGLCIGGQIAVGVRTRFGRGRGRWRGLLRARRPASHVYVWADAVGAGLVAAVVPWGYSHQMALAAAAFAGAGVFQGVVQSIRVHNGKYG